MSLFNNPNPTLFGIKLTRTSDNTEDLEELEGQNSSGLRLVLTKQGDNLSGYAYTPGGDLPFLLTINTSEEDLISDIQRILRSRLEEARSNLKFWENIALPVDA
jgi:hypothetical protein